jgi:hypothetical protein
MKWVIAWIAIGVVVYGSGELLARARDRKIGRITLTTRRRQVLKWIGGVILWPAFLIAYVIGAFWAVHRVAMYSPPKPRQRKGKRRTWQR